jgi:hypothetical protein
MIITHDERFVMKIKWFAVDDGDGSVGTVVPVVTWQKWPDGLRQEKVEISIR